MDVKVPAARRRGKDRGSPAPGLREDSTNGASRNAPRNAPLWRTSDAVAFQTPHHTPGHAKTGKRTSPEHKSPKYNSLKHNSLKHKGLRRPEASRLSSGREGLHHRPDILQRAKFREIHLPGEIHVETFQQGLPLAVGDVVIDDEPVTILNFRRFESDDLR